MPKKRKTALAVLSAAVLLSLLNLILRFEIQQVAYVQNPQSESNAVIPNPYIGRYRMFPYLLADNMDIDTAAIHDFNDDINLVMLQINLSNYKSGPISDTALMAFDTILSLWEDKGHAVILRLLYDWNGNPAASEPDDIDIVLLHLEQTAGIINKHQSAVYIMQGVLLGSWGEMHSSILLSDDTMKDIMGAMHKLISPDIFLSVRTPEQWRICTGSPSPLSPNNPPQDSTLSRRLGLYNDGMLGSVTDCGTYADINDSVMPYSIKKRHRENELLFQDELCKYVPNGGEAILPNIYNDFENAIKDMAQMHVSYLNDLYDPDVLAKWASSYYDKPGPFEQIDGLTYIMAHLGYRYFIKESAIQIKDKVQAELFLIVQNNGFAPAYRDFNLEFILCDTSFDAVRTQTIDTSTKNWNPGTSTTVSTMIDIEDLQPGTYSIKIRLKDPMTGHIVMFANMSSEKDGWCSLGQLVITKTPIYKILISKIRSH